MVNRAVTKEFESAVFQTALKQSVCKCVAKLHSVDPIAAREIDEISFTVPVARFNKHEVEKSFLKKTRTEKRFVKLAKEGDDKKRKDEDGIQATSVDSARSTSSSRDVSDGKKTNRRKYSMSTSSDESDTRLFGSCL